jgi:hypothetical protein
MHMREHTRARAPQLSQMLLDRGNTPCSHKCQVSQNARQGACLFLLFQSENSHACNHEVAKFRVHLSMEKQRLLHCVRLGGLS